MKITILCVGKIKEKFYTDAIFEYKKRLGRYCKIEMIEVTDEKTEENLSETEIRLIKEKEGDRILKNIKNDAYIIALCIDGKQIDSIELSKKMESLATQGVSHICFIIGGSLGLSDAVINRAHFKLSFSKMTFPHQLMRVILMEQTYRAYRIMKNEPYHK